MTEDITQTTGITAKLDEAAKKTADLTVKADEAVKKTANTYETVSEEKILEEAKDVEKVTEKMIEKEKVKEEKTQEVEKEKAVKVMEKGKNFTKDRRAEEAKIQLEAWVPKTKLGKEVKEGKIKNIQEIFDEDRKILEPQVVDLLLPLQTDLIAIGQSKGKFGGGKRRAWRQTQRITREGGVMTFSAMAVVGDEKGHIGVGVGKAGETLPARDKATRKAKLNIGKITLGCSAFDCSCDDPHSIPFQVEGKSGSVRLTLIPAPQGTGLVVANELKKVLKLAGIKDVYSKVYGQTRTTFNLIKACIDALEKTNRK